jgi:hypothetical protein
LQLAKFYFFRNGGGFHDASVANVNAITGNVLAIDAELIAAADDVPTTFRRADRSLKRCR